MKKGRHYSKEEIAVISQTVIGKSFREISDAELINFGDSVSELTMFADYRVPQILREIKILHYNEELAKKIDNKEEISHGSCFEVELRAATIIAVEDIKAELAMKNKKVLSLEIDTYLWEEGEKIKEKIQPPHHTLSIFY